MASLWTFTPQPADQAQIGFNSEVAVQLPDGTLVYVIEDGTGANVKLYYSTDHVTQNLISTFALPINGTPLLTLCVDASGNIYVLYMTAAATLSVKAFVKGTGYSWTGQTALAVTTAAQVSGTPCAMVWTNTGGGTAGAGHLVVTIRTTGAGHAQIGTLDAGVALAGSGTIIAGALTDLAAGTANVLDISCDGFGATQGLVAIKQSVAINVYSWQVSSTGVVTVATVVSAIAGFGTGVNYARLLSYAPGAQGWVLLAQSSVNTNQVAAASLSMTAVTSAATYVAPTGGDWPNVGANTLWAALVDPTTPNRVYLLTWANVALGVVRQLGLTTSPLTWDAGDTASDTSVGAPNITGAEWNLRTTKEPQGDVVDFIAWYSANGNATFALAGDALQFEASVNVPTLVTPVNGTYIETLSGVTLQWTYNTADGSTQAGFCIRYRIAGASGYRYWNVALGASQATPVWNAGASQSFTLPAGAMTDGHLYNWSVSTLSSTRIESGFAADNTLVAAANPSIAVTAPTGTVSSTTYPVVTWVPSFGVGIAQTAYRVVLYTAAQAAIGGFLAGTSPSTYDSGLVMSTATSFTIPQDVPNAAGYKVYVQVTQTGGQVSNFASSTFTESATLPATPTLTATATVDGNGTPCIKVIATDHEGSLSGSTTLTVLRGDGATMRGCPAAITVAGQSVTLYDYEVTSGVLQSYTATVTATPSPGQSKTSLTSAAATATVTVSTHWLIDPLNPTTQYQALQVEGHSPTRSAQKGVHVPLGPPGVVTYPVILSSGFNGTDGTLTVQTQSQAEYASLMSLIQASSTLWFSTPLGEGSYVHIGPAPGGTGGSAALHQTNVAPSPAATPVRQVQLTYVGQPRP